MDKLPKFVSLNGTALRLQYNQYYRDAGEWGIGYRIIEGVLLSWCWGSKMPWLHKQPLIEITEEEWRIDNGHYAPKKI
jgi:hypothetical protein